MSQSTGRVLYGLPLTPGLEAMVNAVLRRLESTYTPDLGAHLVYVPGNVDADAGDVVEKAAPDGATVLMTSSAAMTLVPMVTKRKTPRDDLLPAAGIGQLPYAFIIGPAVPSDIESLAAFLRWATVNPDFAKIGVPGRGTASHFIGSEVVRMSGVSLTSVGYRNAVPLVADVASGSMAAGVVPLVCPGDAAKYPGIRMLAVSSQARWPGSDDVPTLMDLGFAETPVTTSLGFFVSDRVPADKVAELTQAIKAAVQDPSVRATMESAGVLPLPGAADYPAFVAEERAQWAARIERHPFSMQT